MGIDLKKIHIDKTEYLNFDKANALHKAINHNADTLANVIIVLKDIDERLEALEYLHTPAVALADNPNENAANPDTPKENPQRLTVREWRNLDPWEMCGQDAHCNHTSFDAGGCRRGCIVPKIYAKLAKIEDEQEAAESKGAKD